MPDPVTAFALQIFINVDLAAECGCDKTIDLDWTAFERKDTAELSKLSDGTSLVGSVYVRVSATPTPSVLMPTKARTVQGFAAGGGGSPKTGVKFKSGPGH
jgi:hypothetical protein